MYFQLRKKYHEAREVHGIMGRSENIEEYQQYMSVSLIIAESLMLIHARDNSGQLEARGRFTSRKKISRNENHRWHGTTRTYSNGNKGVTEFWSNPSCSFRCIGKTPYDHSLPVSTGKLGSEIYTSATSSKFVPVPTKATGDAL